MKKKLKKCCRENIQKLLERIKLKEQHWVHGHLPGETSCKRCWEDKGYNNAIADLEKLKEEIKNE